MMECSVPALTSIWRRIINILKNSKSTIPHVIWITSWINKKDCYWAWEFSYISIQNFFQIPTVILQEFWTFKRHQYFSQCISDHYQTMISIYSGMFIYMITKIICILHAYDILLKCKTNKDLSYKQLFVKNQRSHPDGRLSGEMKH